MATRVNKKLLIIVVSCVVIALGVLGVVAFQQYRQDPTRFLKAGDAAMARGDFREAARNYGRAIGKRPNEVEFHNKYLDAAGKIIPESRQEAGEKYTLWVGSLLKRAQIKRNDETLWRGVLEETRFHSELNDTVAAWKALYEVASEDLLRTLDPTDPLVPTAKALMGYAQARRIGALTPEEITATVALLEGALATAKGADRDIAYGGLLNLRFEQALAMSRSSQSRQAADAWKVFDELYAKAIADVPDGFEILRTGMLRVRARALANDPTLTPQAMAAAADALADRAAALGDQTSTFQATKVLGTPGVPDGMKRAAKLLVPFLEKHPDAVVHRQALAFCLGASKETVAEAEKEALKIIEAPRIPVSLASAVQDESRVNAAKQLFDLDFGRLDGVSSNDAKAEIIKKLEVSAARIRELAKGEADDSIVLKTDGKLALAKDDFATADQKFKEVFRKGTLIDLELYVLASAVAEQRGETGQAQQLANKGLEMAPNNLQLLARVGSLAMRNGRFTEARAAAERMLAAAPDDEGAKRLLAAAKEGEHPTMVDPNDPLIQKIKQLDDLRVKKDLNAGRPLLEELLKDHPDDVRILTVAMLFEFDAKDMEAARKYADHALELSPGNPTITRIRSFIVGGDDPVARVEAAVATEFPREPDKTVYSAIRMAQSVQATQDQIARAQKTDATEAARLTELLPRVQAAAKRWEEAAIKLDPLHPAWLDFRFSNTLAEENAKTGPKDYKTAESIIAEAERSGRSPAMVALFRGRLALVQGRAGEAATLLQKSIDTNIDDSDVFRMLGIALEQAGDLPGAVKNYAEAYRRKPTDLNAAKTYVAGLGKSGDRAGALTVLRDLRKIAPSDEDITESWLDLEAEIGDRVLARDTRSGAFQVNPANRRNAIKFAAMLAELQPDRADIADAAGKVKYTEATWRALDERTRQQELEKVRTTWQQESDEVFAKLIAAEPQSKELAMVRAATFRHQGRYDKAEGAIRDLISRAGGKPSSDMYVALGVHFVETNGPDAQAKAAEAFAEAQKLQDDNVREADASIAEYYFQRYDFPASLTYRERFAQAKGERTVAQRRTLALRLAETYSRVSEFDKANAALAEAIKLGERDLYTDQLEGTIAEGRGTKQAADDRAAAGVGPVPKAKIDEVLKIYDQGLAALANAAKTAPNNATVAVQQAWLLRKKFDVSGDPAFLDAALAAADRGTKLRGEYWPAAQAKSQLLLDKAKPSEAVVELERFVRAAPSDKEGRERLIQVLNDNRNAARAIEVAREAIRIAPNEPKWRAAIAEVYLSSGQLDNAIDSYEQADKLRPSDEYLSRLTDLRLRQPKPAWAEILASLRAREASVKRTPYLQSAIGVALANSGDMRNGLDVLRSSYQSIKASIKAGSAESLIDSWFTNLRLVYPLSRTDEAAKFLNEISGNKPTTRDQRWIAEMWYASGPEGANRAVEVAESALASDDNKDKDITARLFDIIGGAKFSQGDCKGALAAFAKAVTTLPNEPAVLNNFAYLSGECSDDPTEGLAAAENAVRIAPGQAEYLDTLGFVQGKMGQHDAAVATLKKALESQNSASANLHLAQVLLAMGRRDEAKTYAAAAGDLKPDPMLQKQINALIEKLR